MESEQSLIDRIRIRHPAPSWAVFDHVRNQTGFRKSKIRTADAIALGLWPSNGLSLHGYEVKCSKSDLMNELKDPTKSAEFSQFCNYWWVVVSDISFIEGLAIPDSWGILSPHKNSLKAWRPAPTLTPKPMDIEFVCGIVRRFSECIDLKMKDMIPRSSIEERIQIEVEGKVSVAKREGQFRIASLEKVIADFQATSGLRIDQWNSGNIGSLVRLIERVGRTKVIDCVRGELARSKNYVSVLEKFCSENPDVGGLLNEEPRG